jgi:hypothetical protein
MPIVGRLVMPTVAAEAGVVAAAVGQRPIGAPDLLAGVPVVAG